MSKLPSLAASLALALTLAGCGSERPTEAEYLGVVSQAVRTSVEDARAHAPPGSGTGPLLIDVRSFSGGGVRAIGEQVPAEKVEQSLRGALGAPFQDAPTDSSFTCMELEMGPSCWVPRNGMFVHLNVASRASGEMTLHVTSRVTASHYIPPVICDRILRMNFVKEGERWVMKEKEPTRTCG